MADWTTIPDVSLEPGKPIRSIDVLALRDNPVAIAEGAAGAPRIQLPAIFEALASVPVGSVGSYAFLRPANSTDYGAGSTLAGSSLRYQGALTGFGDGALIGTATFDGGAPAGTWRCMGQRVARSQDANSNFGLTTPIGATLWLRIL